MKISVKVTPNGLIPLYDSDYDKKQMLKEGEIYTCEIRKSRNLKFHRKFFALVRLTVDNLPHNLQDSLHIYTEDDMLTQFKIDLGLVSFVQVGNREVLKERSISFASMDETQFDGFYQRCLTLVLKKYLAGTSRRDLLDNIEQYY